LNFKQTKRPKSREEQLEESILSRLGNLEKYAERASKSLKAFISFKFDDAQVALQVERLKRFLTLLEVDWTTAEEYEPRRIEDKVRARLRADVNCVIAVVTKAGPSSWIRDEMGDAGARNLSVVALLEKGATFDSGIFGGLEYITYDLCIDQTFIKLVEGIKFIKAELASSSSPLPT
jgi:hypothetical protein